MSVQGRPGSTPRASAVRPARSIRRELSLWLLAPLVVLVPLAAALLYAITVRPALDSLDHGLSGTALALANLLSVDAGRVVLPLSGQTEAALRTDPTDDVDFAAIDPQGRLLAGSADLAALAGGPGVGPWRFFDGRLRGVDVRVAEYAAPCGGAGCVIRVAESVGKRGQAQRQVIFGAGLTMLLLSVALLVLGRAAIARALRPLDRLSQDLARRSLGHLQPEDVADVPTEAAPVAVALNRLLDRLQTASQAQQAFLADAAHQLRTPLTALRTESELALLEPHPPALDATLERLRIGTTRAARLADQLLAVARADHFARSTPAAMVDLKQLAAQSAQDWVRPSIEAGIDLGFELEPAWVEGYAFLLGELLGNLLHNAIEYAGRGARVTVRTALRGGRAVLEVEDTGPGIPADERARVLERFQRGRDASGSGSGLGLSIVRDIAQAHGATLELPDTGDGGGLCVRVVFQPGAAAPQAF